MKFHKDIIWSDLIQCVVSKQQLFFSQLSTIVKYHPSAMWDWHHHNQFSLQLFCHIPQSKRFLRARFQKSNGKMESIRISYTKRVWHQSTNYCTK